MNERTTLSILNTFEVTKPFSESVINQMMYENKVEYKIYKIKTEDNNDDHVIRMKASIRLQHVYFKLNV